MHLRTNTYVDRLSSGRCSIFLSHEREHLTVMLVAMATILAVPAMRTKEATKLNNAESHHG